MFALSAGIATIAASAAAGAFEYRLPTVSYSGEMVMTRGSRTVTVKTWYTPSKVRLDTNANGYRTVMIADKAAGTMTMLFPGKKKQFAQRMPPEMFGPLGKIGPGPGSTFDKVAAENVNGVDAIKYKVSGKNRGGTPLVGHIWLTRDNIVVRMVGTLLRGGAKQPFSMDLRKLRVGAVDPSIFAIPPKSP